LRQNGPRNMSPVKKKKVLESALEEEEAISSKLVTGPENTKRDLSPLAQGGGAASHRPRFEGKGEERSHSLDLGLMGGGGVLSKQREDKKDQGKGLIKKHEANEN